MATELKMWKSSDGKIFESPQEADAHDFAVKMCRIASTHSRTAADSAYLVLKELHAKGWIKPAIETESK